MLSIGSTAVGVEAISPGIELFSGADGTRTTDLHYRFEEYHEHKFGKNHNKSERQHIMK